MPMAISLNRKTAMNSSMMKATLPFREKKSMKGPATALVNHRLRPIADNSSAKASDWRSGSATKTTVITPTSISVAMMM